MPLTRHIPIHLSLFLAFFLSLNHGLTHADVELPAIDEKYITLQQQNPSRDAGYVVGDKLSRIVVLNIKKPYVLVKESLPIVGYEHRYKGQISGVELTQIAVQENKKINSNTHTLYLDYQIFTTSRVAKPAVLRAEIIKIRNEDTKELWQYRIPAFSFRISPMSVFGEVNLKEELSPFSRPLYLDSHKEIQYLQLSLGLVGLSLLGLLYIFGTRTWLPRMGAPFAKAYRDMRKYPDTASGTQQAIARLHQALNTTAHTSLFGHNIDSFLQEQPRFLPLRAEIEKFYQLSKQVFFDQQITLDLGKSNKTWLLKLCRHLRDCERGLKPEANAS